MSSITKRVLFFVVAASLIATFMVGCGRGVVAKVAGRKITRQEYYDRLERLPYADQQSGQTMEAGALVLQRLITEELILRLADKERCGPTDQQINDRIASAMKQPGFAANLKKTGVSKEQFREMMRVEQGAFNLQTRGVKVTPDDVKAFYEQNKSTMFTAPEQVYLAGIFLNSKSEADKAMALLKSGVEFGTVARTMSKHPSAKMDGKLAPISRGSRGIPQAVQDIVFATPKDKWTNPIASGGGSYAIFQVLQHIPKKEQRLADVQNVIHDRMMLQKGVQKNANLNEELTKFRDTSKIDVMVERYKSYILPPKEAPAAPGGPAKDGKK
jgi:parvulin-like peptidyl-prolyl isomerase